MLINANTNNTWLGNAARKILKIQCPNSRLLSGLAALLLLMTACQPAAKQSGLKVLAVETFLADITQNIAGSRLHVEALVPVGVDPHAFEPTPQDIARIADSDMLIVNGAGFEAWLEKTVQASGGHFITVQASSGLTSRVRREGEAVMLEQGHDEGDPHFWLDPVSVIRYVENIRDGLVQIDPQGKDVYTNNAEDYINQLKTLDGWVAEQVKQVPQERRKMVTNHESLGYFADRYGFEIIGTVIPSVSSSASPSAQQLARLVDTIRASHAPAIFLETGSNPQLADQLAQETGIKVVTDLYTHSTTQAGGEAPTYLEMMKANTRKIVDALK
jgi:ABC-type Zn uptake system ZnuABC Zn-binding protein ZnuA